MCKIDVSCIFSIIYKCVMALSILLISGLFAQENKPIIGVLGLDNGGGVGNWVIDSVCNRISMLIEKEPSKYLVLKREFIPIVLQEQGFTVSNEICFRIEGLAASGLLLSADEMIGGSIKKDTNGITVELIRIRVNDRIQLAAHKITTILSRQDFLDLELPGVVEALISNSKPDGLKTGIKPSLVTQVSEDKVSVVTDTRSKHSNIKQHGKGKGIRLLTTSIILTGAAAAGAFYYLRSHRDTPSEAPFDNDIPFGNLPTRMP
ncbi:MAG TPA: hypothetical protein VHO70_02855 [Chitinispirillaceae bacterium]|nr:hypothetical protein [Chitinispirillaceae bacterium]